MRNIFLLKLLFIFLILAKCNPLNAQVIGLDWAKKISSFGGDSYGYSVVTDNFGNVYSTGIFNENADLDPGPGSYTLGLINSGKSYAYVLKLDPLGNLVWAKSFSDSLLGYNKGSAIAVDALGDVYIAGTFGGIVDFDPGSAVYNLSGGGAFILKLNALGDFVYAKQITSSQSIDIRGMLTDPTGNVLVTGSFNGSLDFLPSIGTATLNTSGQDDIFILKLDAFGNYFWGKQIGGTMSDISSSIELDVTGNIYLSGSFKGVVDFDPGFGVMNMVSNGGLDCFILKLNSGGNFLWVKQFGGILSDDEVNTVKTDIHGNVYSSGYFGNTTVDFNPNAGVFNLTAINQFGAGCLDAFIMKMDSTGSFLWAKQIGGPHCENAQSMCLDTAGNVYTTGFFGDPCDFDPGPSYYALPFTWTPGQFISKLDKNGSFLWAKNIDGISSPGGALAASIKVDLSGSLYLTGSFKGQVDFDPNVGVYSLASNSFTSFEPYILKLKPCLLPAPLSPTNTTIPANQLVCANKTTTLSAASSSDVLWYSTPTSTLVLGSGLSFVTPTLTVGSYTYYASAYNCISSLTRTPITLTVLATPSLVVSAPGLVISGGFPFLCIGNTATLSVVGANTYTWSNGSNLSTTTVSPSSNTNYTVMGMGINGCISQKTILLKVSGLPSITVNSGTICSGQTFTFLPSGTATSYSYSAGSNVVSPTTNVTYTITGVNSLGCKAVAISSVNVNPSPTLTVAANNSVCDGSSIIISASGANSYTWNTGANTSSIVSSPTSSTIYTVTGTNLNNCSNSQTVSVIVDPTCQDVWPGDANSDGMADNLDILELGLHYTQTGPPRASTSNAWQSYFANNWTGTISNGKNLNHSDCNGDGIINDSDTLAIYNNYGLTHAFKPAQPNTVNPQLSIVPDQLAVAKGAWGTASIYLGDSTTNINNINGLAFTVDFDNTLVETNSIYIEYQNSFIDAGQNLDFRKLDFSNGKIFTATTHTVNNNVSGNGKIATLHYQIKSSLTTDQALNLGISQANQSAASGIITPLTVGTGTLMAIGSSVGLKELISNLISISPNPTNGLLTINSKTELQKIEVTSITGALLLSETPTNVSHTLHLENFSNGIYFVNVYQNDRVVKREKIVLNN
jgi:hypothetical protein